MWIVGLDFYEHGYFARKVDDALIIMKREKLKRANGMLSKARHFVPTDEIKSIYYAIFSSLLTYGCQVWGIGRGAHIEKISKLQNRALRIINFKNFHADSNPLYIHQKILKFQDFIRLQNCLFVHDFLNNSLPKCYIYFNVQTRNSNLGCLVSPSKNTTKQDISNNGPP